MKGKRADIYFEPENSDSHAGLFISLEGVESSGKTTQADLLTSWLMTRGHQVLQTREPGGCSVAESIRSLLLSAEREADEHIAPETEALLFAASRAQLVHNVIRPALQGGAVVVCDRFVDSSLAYQGYGLGIPLAQIWDINMFATGNLMPDLTFVLGRGSDLFSAQQRPAADRIEARSEEFHHRVRRGYHSLAQRFSDRIVLVDTRGGVRRTAQYIRGIVGERLDDKHQGS